MQVSETPALSMDGKLLFVSSSTQLLAIDVKTGLPIRITTGKTPRAHTPHDQMVPLLRVHASHGIPSMNGLWDAFIW